MKVSRESQEQYKPVTITLETHEEEVVLVAILEHVKNTYAHGSLAREFAAKMLTQGKGYSVAPMRFGV